MTGLVNKSGMAKPTLHIIAPWHTVLDPDTGSACAFSMKAFKLSAMMEPLGYRCVEYANEGSKSKASEKVVMLSRQEYDGFYPKQKSTEFPGSNAVIGTKGWSLFNRRLIVELSKRVNKGDIICHVFGRAHQSIPSLFPDIHSVESGVGFPDEAWDCWRIFESEIWRHYHWGRDDAKESVKNQKGMNRYYSWVIPNSFDVDEWPYHGPEQNDDYVLFMSRIDPCKGLNTLVAIIREDALIAKEENRKPTRWVFAGQGDFDKHILSAVKAGDFKARFNVEHRGVVNGKNRASLVGKARCMILPTNYVEPFGGAVVEGMCAGTPAVTVDYGCFVETVQHGVTGYRCHTLGDFLQAIRAAKNLDRSIIAAYARSKYSLEACAKLYDRAFSQICELSGPGWNSRKSHWVD